MHDEILNDLVYPTEIVGKRIRYRVDGSKVLKVRHGYREGSELRVGALVEKWCVDRSWHMFLIACCG